MHLGEEDSLLTNLKTASTDPDPSQASPVLKQLVECLNALISHNESPGKPTLILNGDILELALTTDNQAAMGRSGDAGQDIEIIYEKMQDPEQFKKLLANVATGLAKLYDLPGWGDVIEAKLLGSFFDVIVDAVARRERHHTDSVLSQDAEKGLWAYMNGPLRRQILTELKGNMPADVTFVFGHTHKPFQQDMNFKGYPQWVNVYNTGGWVVETVKPAALHGGAVVLVDENLDATSLRLYNESDDPNSYVVKVQEAIHPGEDNNPFHKRIAGLVDPSADPWKSFSAMVARAASVREQNLRARINEKR